MFQSGPMFCLVFSEGGFFKAILDFPKEYPLRPPRMKIITEIWHPNSKFEQFSYSNTAGN